MVLPGVKGLRILIFKAVGHIFRLAARARSRNRAPFPCRERPCTWGMELSPCVRISTGRQRSVPRAQDSVREGKDSLPTFRGGGARATLHSPAARGIPCPPGITRRGNVSRRMVNETRRAVKEARRRVRGSLKTESCAGRRAKLPARTTEARRSPPRGLRLGAGTSTPAAKPPTGSPASPAGPADNRRRAPRAPASGTRRRR